MSYRWLAVALTLAVTTPVFGQDATQQADEDAPVTFEDQVVVTASRAEQELVNAPAAVSLITSDTIARTPATNIGELLRAVPGLNVAQTSARDVNLTSRGSTSTLATSQLALVDGRSVYLDFFGLVMWDLIPTNPAEIDRIEVIRGPASAVWGANAMSGVVNVITKSPRQLALEGGTSASFGVGTFGRNVPGQEDDSYGTLFYMHGAHAEAVNDRLAFKVSASLYSQDALARPAGNIDNSFGTPYPPFSNTGTSQPKFDVRADYEMGARGTVSLSGGLAGTEGIIHSGIGPFDVERGTRLGYLSAAWDQGSRHVAFFSNILHGIGTNLLTVSAAGTPLPLFFDTKTFNIEASDARTVGARHLLSYGGNYRRNTFDISLAPNGDDRNEGGAYLQDEIFLNERFRWVVGGRIDKFSSIDSAVFSPRTTLLFKPEASQTVRLSFNRAFRAPSFVNNNIDTVILNQANLSALHPLLSRFVFPVASVGNPDLKQETMTAWEVGYTGVLAGRATINAAVYWNTVDDGIYFTQVGAYSAANPPATYPRVLPTFLLGFIPAPGLPSLFTYRNLGTVKDKGIELGVDGVVSDAVTAFANYSYQWEPVVEGFDASEVNQPPQHRVNIGAGVDYDRYFGNLTVSYTADAFWQDVLDARYWGPTDAFTLVNTGLGVRWADGRYVTSLKVTNLLNQDIQQHVFGDIMKRQVVGELRVDF
jgi:outer membrane receptor protein involved in Fe transport